MILVWVRTAQQTETPGGFVAYDARVVAGRKAIETDTERTGAGGQEPELHDRVAEGAGVRGEPRQILVAEGAEHMTFILVGQRYGVVGDAETFSRCARRRDVRGFVRTVAGVVLCWGEGPFGIPDAHCQPDDITPLLFE